MTYGEVYTNLPRSQVADFIRSIPGRITGRTDDVQGVGRGFRARIGMTLYSLIAESFEAKSHHGTDTAGEKWPDNSPEYLAYQKHRAKHRKDKNSYRIFRTDHLTPDQRKVWAKANAAATKKLMSDMYPALAKRMYRKKLSELSTRHAPKEASRRAMEYAEATAAKEVKWRAAISAWSATRKAGASSLISHYPGSMEDTILVDHGFLRQSIQPGELIERNDIDARYDPANKEQIFEDADAKVVVGSKNKTAGFHHNSKKLKRGDGKRGTVRRRLWPEELPDLWWDEILAQGVAGLMRIEHLLRRGQL